ncbi:ubiquinone/menaquinone biosynthesis C-methylase UbiE [Caldalkalibacillus uzonensis]|jgi:ubiquinone/menaquinone biosynthesis C-methylase UbiE|uniref:Ubiquinone/menaquinone biosynthesis C-methylase UbiE n=1 Tax=Caldalkalibacillus uzonensis TaxID=353224 RepID=A0ABU0CY36_9BACI|nr:class I SAM-dependent methyltransferase [Caldalkalibacillus uzonensis]MDQ0341053.1 ubiquinone/menaquinone biosynthesis C-methylase UbiE [Caldalkalibacillus uzonensis]
MDTSWSSKEIARAFEYYEDIPEQLLGYRFIFRQFEELRTTRALILDYGCGPGKVALRYVTQAEHSVLAVDASESMLEIARQRRSHPFINYRLVKNDRLDFVKDDSVDGAMTCYVFINIASEEQIRRIIKEIYRVLKPGAKYIILDTNPDTTGISFSTFRSGESGRQYAYGEQREVRLRLPDHSELILYDYHWPKKMYIEALREAGFSIIDVLEPTLKDIPKQELESFTAEHSCSWMGETEYPPFVIFVARK